jgi:predicted dehydrogenase
MKRRIAIIGLGLGAPPHAKSMIDLAGRAEVVWAASRSQARCAAFAEKFPFPTTTDIDRAIGDESIEAAILVTPPNTHLDLVRRCAAAGKHVVLEKPLEVSTARAEELVRAARDARVRLGVVLQFRFRESSVRFRDLVESGALGEIALATVSVPWWRPQDYYDEPGRGSYARDGGGVLITQAIHTLDLFQSLVGGVREVSAVAATSALHRMESEDFVAAGLVLGDGAPGSLLATTALYPGFSERIEVVGTLATAVLAGEALEVRWHDGRRETAGSDRPTGSGDPMDFAHDAHRALLADFLDALDEGRDPQVTGEEVLKVHRLIDALVEAGRSGRRVAV